MDVDYAAREVGGNSNEVKETGHHDEIGVGLSTRSKERVAPLAYRLTARRKNADWNAGTLGDPHAPHVAAAGNDDIDRR
jgi:hypothetical protein